MIEGLALPPTPPAAYVAHVETPALVLVKKRKSNRTTNKRRISPAVVVGAWVLLSDGRQCKVSAVLPNGKVYCSEVQQ